MGDISSGLRYRLSQSKGRVRGPPKDVMFPRTTLANVLKNCKGHRCEVVTPRSQPRVYGVQGVRGHPVRTPYTYIPGCFPGTPLTRGRRGRIIMCDIIEKKETIG